MVYVPAAKNHRCVALRAASRDRSTITGFCRSKNRVTQTWLICGECNGKLRDTDFKAEMRSAFESYQQALRPFLGRQIPMVLFEAAGKMERAGLFTFPE